MSGEALGILSDSQVDLLITDHSMPDLSGLELVGLLHDRLEMRKVLLTFSRIEIRDRVKIAEAGIDGIITKPVDENHIKES